MLRRISVLLLTALLSVVPAAAQFYNDGNEPAGVRWRQIKTQDYKLIFPEGLDSLARVYAAYLEAVKEPVGATAGYTPNQLYRKRLPVIMHPYTANANGMVAWTPSRMELRTTPQYSAPLPSPWTEHLVIHESRHVSQMQAGYEKPYKGWNIVFGQLFPGAMDIMYGGLAFFEGDAVAAETELTASGRGRNAEFLEYYRAAFREGDTRDWWQWRYGSLKYFTPDYYTIGYITAAGMRSLYDTPDFTARFYKRLTANKCWPFPFFNYNKTVKEVAGKPLRSAFSEISDTLRLRWSRDEEARAPFQPSERITAPQRHYTDFSGTCVFNGSIYSIRRGTTVATELVRVSEGGVKTVRPFARSSSPLKVDSAGGRIWWSEIVNDSRWEMVSYSEVWYLDSLGRRHCLKPRTRWYNPSISADGKRLAVTEYATGGEAFVLVLEAGSGKELERFRAPDGMQPVEPVWLHGNLYACAITEDGQGIYDVRDGYRLQLACGYSVVKQMFSRDGALYFTSDLGGVDELYSFVPGEEKALRITNTATGASSYCFADDGSLLYSMQTRDGRFIYTTPADSLPAPQPADFGTPYRYAFAEELADGGPGRVNKQGDIKGVEIGDPQPYNKLANAFRVHSWAPIYVNYDAIEELSFSTLLSSAGLGAIAFFQNELNTLQGSVAYNAGYSDRWIHKGEAKITYRGLYPVIELGASISSDAPEWYFLKRSFGDHSTAPGWSLDHKEYEGIPSLNASVTMYLPITKSSGGWTKGIIPKLRWGVSNSIITKGETALMNRLTATVRGYIVKSTPSSCVYPKLGAGAELGWSGRPGATGIFEPNAYFYTYGYLPGFMDTHGMRLSGIVQLPHGKAMFSERYASVLPRGMGAYSNLPYQVASYPVQTRFTADYTFPFASLDWSGMGNIAYVRNLECTLHGDYSFFGGSSGKDPMHLGGAGAELCVVFGNFLWIPFDTRIGVKYYYNMGIPGSLNPHQFDMVFSVDL